jgi:hypothetical protein
VLGLRGRLLTGPSSLGLGTWDGGCRQVVEDALQHASAIAGVRGPDLGCVVKALAQLGGRTSASRALVALLEAANSHRV